MVDAKDDQKCDMCQGSFVREILNPISGDWWLCDECLEVYFPRAEPDAMEWRPDETAIDRLSKTVDDLERGE